MKDNGLRSCWSAMNPAIRRSCTTSRRACASTSRGASPRIATSSARHPRHLHSRPARETKETIEETIKFATEINPHIHPGVARAPYPGTFPYKQAMENRWLVDENMAC